jgi:hypothetical protein
MESIKESKVYEILNQIADLNFENVKPCCNERYLHHYFSEKIQKYYPIVYEDITKSQLHPEWATAIKGFRNGGKYKKVGNEYKIDDNGTSGFIDFAIGNYEKPEFGIEFKFCKSWNFQSVVFDYMKLLDSTNSIKKAISFSIIYRQNNFSNKLPKELNKTISELQKRLGDRMESKRPFLFWIIEIVQNGKKQSWICDSIKKKFVSGFPY